MLLSVTRSKGIALKTFNLYKRPFTRSLELDYMFYSFISVNKRIALSFMRLVFPLRNGYSQL